MMNNIEDIKIVEERIETLNKHISNYEKSECRTSVYQELVKEKQAIENILNAYIHEKVAKEEVEELLENSISKRKR